MKRIKNKPGQPVSCCLLALHLYAQLALSAAAQNSTPIENTSQQTPPSMTLPDNYEGPGIRGETGDINTGRKPDQSPVKPAAVEFQKALEAFEQKHGKTLPPELRARIEATFNLYHEATLDAASNIIQAEDISPDERAFELEIFLRSRQGEWTPATVIEWGIRKGIDVARDAVIEAALTYYLGGVPSAVKRILFFNSFGKTVLPGASDSFAEDIVNWWQNQNHTEMYAKVIATLRESRDWPGKPELLKQHIQDYIQKAEQANQALTQQAEHTIHQDLMVKVRDISRDMGLNSHEQQMAMQYVGGVFTQSEMENFEELLSNKMDAIQVRLWFGRCGAARNEALKNARNAIAQIAINDLYKKAMQIRLASIDDRAVENSIIVLIDASGSMKGAKISSAKATASRQIAGLGPETELSVIAFSGSQTRTPFLLMNPAGKARALAAVHGISANGGTPLAAAIRNAGNFMRRSAQGDNMTLIILSDGVETEGGDPPAEVARLNDMSVSW